jgi:hypothetical protein
MKQEENERVERVRYNRMRRKSSSRWEKKERKKYN